MGMTADEVWEKLRRPFDEKRAIFESRIFALIEHRSNRLQTLRNSQPDQWLSVEEYFSLLIRDGIALSRLRAERYVRICCDIWDGNGWPRDSAFNLAVFDHCLTPLFGRMSRASRRELSPNRLRLPRPHPSQKQLDVGLMAFANELKILRSAWKEKLGLVERQDELPSNEQLGGPYPNLRNDVISTRNERSTSVEHTSVKETGDLRESGGIAVPSTGGHEITEGELEVVTEMSEAKFTGEQGAASAVGSIKTSRRKSGAAIEPVDQPTAGRMPVGKRSGRRRKRAVEFTTVAGPAWTNATRVSGEVPLMELRKIAEILDKGMDGPDTRAFSINEVFKKTDALKVINAFNRTSQRPQGASNIVNYSGLIQNAKWAEQAWNKTTGKSFSLVRSFRRILTDSAALAPKLVSGHESAVHIESLN